MVGKTISHYKITEKLGEGGMGEVYLADDTKLKRQVAIKFLPEHLTKDKENVERFEREAEAAAALNHPNIVTIYDVIEADGQICIIMEYVDGDSLRTKIDDKNLAVEEVLNITNQICEGLTKAHQADIVHRDIKPENILIDTDGRVKILDFGLAKLKGVSKLTKETSTLGTIHYMSPEQLQGKEVDNRSDIWSLGVVLYEMLIGEVPFKGDYESAVMYTVLNEVHEPIKGDRTGMLRQLERIINISLEKDRDLRYQNVSELIADLNTEKPEISTQKTTPVIKEKASKFWMMLAGASAIIIVIIFILYLTLFNKPEDVIDSIAVLPFELKSSDPELEYLGDGIARGISNRLSQLPYLDKVISSSTLKNYKGKDVDAKTIAQNVKVKAVVFGDIVLYRENLTINIELKDGENNSTLWGNRYSRPRTSVHDMEAFLTKLIVDNLGIRLASNEKKRLTKQYTWNEEAYHLYQKGRYFLNRHTEQGFKKGIECFENAIHLDSTYALAYVGLARCYKELSRLSYISHREGYTKAKEAIMKTIEIEETLGEAYAILGSIKFISDWDMSGPELYFQRAIKLSPGSVDVYLLYAQYLMWIGSSDKSIAIAKRAFELDPLTPLTIGWLGVTYFYANRYDESISLNKNILELDPYFVWAHVYLAHNYTMKGMYAEAIVHADKVESISLDIGDYFILSTVGRDYAISGRPEKAQEILEQLLGLSMERSFDPMMVAGIYSGLGDKDKAFDWLAKAYEVRSGTMVYLKAYSKTILKNLSSDPRYLELLKNVGFKE